MMTEEESTAANAASERGDAAQDPSAATPSPPATSCSPPAPPSTSPQPSLPPASSPLPSAAVATPTSSPPPPSTSSPPPSVSAPSLPPASTSPPPSTPPVFSSPPAAAPTEECQLAQPPAEAPKASTDDNGVLNPTFKESIRNDVLEILDHLGIVKDNDFIPKPDEAWVEAKCPARIDLFGGWTDTPPICYEMGGSVVNMGILVDGVKPISAKARFNSGHSRIKLLILEKNGPEQLVIVDNMEQLLDCGDPLGEGALLKACIVACNIFDKEKSLKEQLVENYGGGLDLVSVTHLPHGSGLGTSSILASALCAVVWAVTGNLFDRKSLLQVVLVVEQLLTTGGGWQDQVGGVLGGINRGFSKPGRPLQVRYEPLPVEDAFVDLIEQHMVLLYTGRVRLARNILDLVVSRWYDHCPTMMDCFRKLHTGSMQMQGAVKLQNLAKIASLLTEYWNLKKKLAENSEPPEITQLIRATEPFCVGYSLLGAGGGGFLCVITALPEMHDELRNELRRNSDFDKVTVHRVTLDTSGIQLYRGTSIIRV